MANQRKKKKKNKKAAAAKQAAVQYKGKNAPVRPAAVPKKVAEQPKTEQPNSAKEEVNKSVEPIVKKVEQPQTQEKAKKEVKPDKKAAQVKNNSKQKPKKKKINSNIKLSKQIEIKIKQFGVNKFAAIILAISVAIATVCVIPWVMSSRFGIPDDAVIEYKGKNISSDITLTVLEDLYKQYEYADGMDSKGDKDAFRYYASKELVFSSKNSQAPLNLVNVTDNECVLIATIVDEAGNVCFKSKGLPVGQCLADIGINERPYGTYDMKLVVAGYDPETYELIGVQHSDLTVQVGTEEETSDVQETTKG